MALEGRIFCLVTTTSGVLGLKPAPCPLSPANLGLCAPHPGKRPGTRDETFPSLASSRDVHYVYILRCADGVLYIGDTSTSMAPDDDRRSFWIEVAGPAALLVSKLHKIEERLAEGRASRLDDKDALDALRLLKAAPTERLSRAFGALIQHEVAQVVTREALVRLRTRFASVRGIGTQMAVRAAGPLAASDATVIRIRVGEALAEPEDA